jgi:hypothetical protein
MERRNAGPYDEPGSGHSRRHDGDPGFEPGRQTRRRTTQDTRPGTPASQPDQWLQRGCRRRGQATKDGESDERLFTLAAWPDTLFFTGAERAALALTQAVTRLSDRTDPVSGVISDEAARHYDE